MQPCLFSIFAGVVIPALCTVTQPTFAQGFPDRMVRVVVPTAPGGSIDTTARVVAAKLAALWSKPVVIENRPGAGMIIGADAAAKSPSDGYTLLIAHDGTMAMNPVVYPNLPYHPQRDFAPVALLAAIPEVLLVNAAVPARSVRELIALAKVNPGKLNHATGGTATLLALELFKAMAGVEIASIPFRGGAPAVTGTMSGETQLMFADLATATPAMQSGKLRSLAVTTAQRVPSVPNVPTLDEAGVRGYDVATWIGAFAPAGTPNSIVAKVEAGMKEALASSEVRDKLEALSMQVRSGSSEDMRAVLAADIAKWSRLVREQSIQIPQ